MPYFTLHNLGPKPYLPAEQRIYEERKPLFPAVNIFDFSDQYVVEVAIPGYKKKDVKIELKEDNLLIEGKHEEHPQPKGRVVQNDFKVKEFRRVLQLDKSVDRKNITAQFENGVLIVKLPKVNESLDSKVKVISID